MGVLAALFGLLGLVAITRVSSAEYVRGCYYTSWAQYRPVPGKYTVDNYVPGLCTHLFYAFVVIGSDFKIKNFDWSDDATYDKLSAMRTQQQPDLKIILSMGGWTFSQESVSLLKGMASNAANRATFYKSVSAFLRQKNFDGLDIDWEFPTADDKANYAALVIETRAHFEEEAKESGKPRLLLTAAVTANVNTIDAGYDGKKLGEAFDYVNIMSYDLHMGTEPQTGFNSPLYDRNGDKLSISTAATHWNEVGVPKSKLLIGMATYGRGFLSSGTTVGAPASGATPAQKYTQEGGYAAYYEICDKVDKQGYKRYYDDTQQATYAVGSGQWFGYNDVQSFNAILDWLIKNGYGGAFVWTLDLDDFNGDCPSSNGKYPLLNAIKNKLGGGGPSPQPASASASQPGLSFPCSGAGKYPDAASCSSFYECSGNGATPLRQGCARGMVFNPKTSACDAANNVQC